MIKSFIVLICLLVAGPTSASEIHVRLTAKTSDGTTKVDAYHYTNGWGRREVRLESTALPRLGSVNPILGYGRDTDDDGNIDSWFMIDDEQGIVRFENQSTNVWGQDFVQENLFKSYHSTISSHVSAASGAIFGFLLMSVSHAYESERNLWKEIIDLEEFALRLERSKTRGELTREQWMSAVDVLLAGQDRAIKTFESAMGANYWALGGADVALWLTGGVVIKFLGKGLKFLAAPLSNTALATNAKATFSKMAGNLTSRMKSQFSRFQRLKGAPVNAIAANTLKKQFPSTMRSLMAKNALMRRVVPIVARTGIAFKKAVLEWKYIAFMTTLQLTTEGFAHADEVTSSNPITTAQNVLTHPDIMQNVGYMSSNAFLMTAASHGIRPKGARFATCGFIALTNSTMTNVVIKGSDDYERIALDTGWEAVVGNAQIQIDLKALSHFEKAATKSGNPRLKLLGWAIVLVDQTAGFVGYSQASQALEKSQTDVQLVPVIVEG